MRSLGLGTDSSIAPISSRASVRGDRCDSPRSSDARTVGARRGRQFVLHRGVQDLAHRAGELRPQLTPQRRLVRNLPPQRICGVRRSRATRLSIGRTPLGASKHTQVVRPLASGKVHRKRYGAPAPGVFAPQASSGRVKANRRGLPPPSLGAGFPAGVPYCIKDRPGRVEFSTAWRISVRLRTTHPAPLTRIRWRGCGMPSPGWPTAAAWTGSFPSASARCSCWRHSSAPCPMRRRLRGRAAVGSTGARRSSARWVR